MEADAFKLVQQQINYDLQVLRVAKARQSNFENQLYNQRLQHRRMAYEVSQQAASTFIDAHTLIIQHGSGESLIRNFELFVKKICSNHSLEKNSLVASSRTTKTTTT